MNDNIHKSIIGVNKNEKSTDTIHIIENIDDEFKNNKPDTLIIKGKFQFHGNNIYGIFAFVFNMDILTEHIDENDNILKNPTLSIHVLASYFRDLYDTDIKQSWVVLEDTFNQIKIHGEYAQSITQKIYKSINDALLGDNSIAKILLAFNKISKKTEIELEIRNFINPIYNQNALSLSIELEELCRKDLDSVKQHRIITEKPEINHDILNTPTVQINPMDYHIPAKPIFAPTGNGISINQLSIGMRILMAVEQNNYGQRWIDKFKLFNPKTNKVYPLVGTVEQIGPTIKNSIDILVKYQKDQYTKFNLEADVKIKLYNPISSEPAIDPIIDSTSSLYKSTTTTNNNVILLLLQNIEFRILFIIGIVLTIVSFIALYFISI